MANILNLESLEESMPMWCNCTEGARSMKEAMICFAFKQEALSIIMGDEYPDRKTPQEINEGRCGSIAPRVKKIVEDVVNVEVVEAFFGMSDNHIWIRYNGRHFDAEAPCGVEDPRNLGFFKRRGMSMDSELEVTVLEEANNG